jgi:hypothetical protein
MARYQTKIKQTGRQAGLHQYNGATAKELAAANQGGMSCVAGTNQQMRAWFPCQCSKLMRLKCPRASCPCIHRNVHEDRRTDRRQCFRQPQHLTLMARTSVEESPLHKRL